MILEDFVFLGTTVPEQMSDGRVVRCSAGYSVERQSLVRVYPISPFVRVPRWGKFRIHLDRNPKDSRAESYKLHGDRSNPEALTQQLVDECYVGDVRQSVRLADIDRYLVPSIAYMNERRMSLGVIVPELLGYSFEYDKLADSAVLQLPGMEHAPPAWGRHSFPQRPRLQFMDADGRHDLGLNEHGCYEWLRKGGEQRQLSENLHFGDTGRDVRLLVGNLCNQRNAWVVISYISMAKQQASLFDGADA